MKKMLLALMAIIMSYSGFAQCASTFALSNATPTSTEKLRVELNNTSTPSASPSLTTEFLVKWGDGGMQFVWTGSTYHNYTTPGTYVVWQYMTVLDSVTSTVTCIDSLSDTVTVNYAPCATDITSVVDPSRNGDVTFTVNNLGGSPTMLYFWYFGDGTTYGPTNTTSFTHNFPTTGTYMLNVIAYDSLGGCTDSVNFYLSIMNGCGAADFISIDSGLTQAFYNYSTYMPGAVMNAQWSFGDGTTSTQNSPWHTYATADSYTVCLVTTWVDSLTSNVICLDSICKVINVTNDTNTNNYIYGWIFQDSTLGAPRVDSPLYRIWLISYDSVASTLTAVDSIDVQWDYYYNTYYYFHNEAPGVYLVKAALLNGPASGASYVPTYHTSALMWYNADPVYHSGGATGFVNINMQAGMATSGPGFVGGNISAGANKGTAAGIPNMTVLLLNAAGKPVKSTVTDANGDYEFTDLAPASYSIHPEEAGFATTEAIATVVTGKPTVTGVDFKRSASKKTIVPDATGIANINESTTFAMYPNPAKDKVTIDWKANVGKANVVITDISGKTVYSNEFATSQKAELNLQNLHKGFYFITIETGNVKNTQKLLLQ